MKKHRISSFLIAAVLFLGLAWPIPASAANLYFTAINNSVAPLSSNTMPFWSGGAIYVPYSVFDANLNGINVSLGLYTSYNRSNNTITLFNLRQMLVFDLSKGTCWDEMTGTTYSARAVMRGGTAFLPLNMVSSFFGLSYSYNQLPYISQGYLVRIKSADAVSDDASFIDAAQTVINNRLRDYTQSLSPADTTSPSVNPGTSTGTNPGTSPGPGTWPTPGTPPGASSGTGFNPGGNPGSNPGTTLPTAPPVAPEEPDETETVAYLALRCESAEGLAAAMNALDAAGRSAVFFLTPRLLEEGGDLVRRALGTGHSVGILADSGEPVEELLARGAAALELSARTRTTLACVPAGQRTALEEAGWVCWTETARLQPSDTVSPSSFASSTIRRLKNRQGPVYLTLEGGGSAARVLPVLLRQLGNSDYIVSIPMETRL